MAVDLVMLDYMAPAMAGDLIFVDSMALAIILNEREINLKIRRFEWAPFF